jgi:hypothetical protein
MASNLQLKPSPPRTFVVKEKADLGTRKLLRPVYAMGTEDPILTRVKKDTKLSTIGLLMGISAFTLYAVGLLPQADRLLDMANAYLQVHNDLIVADIVQALPLIVMMLLLGVVGTVTLLHYNRLRRVEALRQA